MIGTSNLRYQGVVSTRREAADHLRSAGDAVLIERGTPRLFLLSCPCGRGELFPINLDERAGPAWRLYIEQERGITIFPSVWRKSGCRSHYIIWRNKILLFGHNDQDWEDSSFDDGSLPSADLVRAQLPVVGLVPFAELAYVFDAVPWDVLRVCRSLVRAGQAREGRGKERSSFGRK